MSIGSRWMIVLGNTTWRIVQCQSGDVQVTEPQAVDRNSFAAAAEQIYASLVSEHYAGEPVLLALGSTQCVVTTVTVPTSRHARNRAAMAYLVEPNLPWSAEETVLDYELKGLHAFVVAAESAPLVELVDHLERCGVVIEFITPLAHLALSAYLSEGAATQNRHLLLWGDGASLDLWLIEDNQAVTWQHLEHQQLSVLRVANQFALMNAQKLTIVGRNLSREVKDQLANNPDFDFQTATEEDSCSLLDAAASEAVSVLDGRRGPGLQFRRDALAVMDRNRAIRGPLRFVQFAALALLAAVGAAFLAKANEYDVLRRETSDRQLDVYRKVFPGRREQVGVRAALEGELARLRGLSGRRSGLPETVESAVVLERLLKSLPKELRFRILEVRIENGHLYLVGHVRDHTDADRIAVALRAVKLQVEPPSTHRLAEKGVEFRLSARLPVETSPKKETSS